MLATREHPAIRYEKYIFITFSASTIVSTLSQWKRREQDILHTVDRGLDPQEMRRVTTVAKHAARRMLRLLAEGPLEIRAAMCVKMKVRLTKVCCYRVAMCPTLDRAKAGNSWTPAQLGRRAQDESKTQCGAA